MGRAWRVRVGSPPPEMQDGVEAGTWPARPSVYDAEAGHRGRAEGQVATWSIVRSALPPTALPVPSFVSLVHPLPTAPGVAYEALRI